MSPSLPKSLSLLALCLLTQGCVGIQTLNVRTRTFLEPSIAEVACANGATVHDDRQTNSVVYTAAWLETHWGKPGAVTRTGKGIPGEIWIYKFDPAWSGIVPFVVIPIPILIPSGREQVLFTMRDGNVISANVRRLHSTGRGYGCYAGICGPHFGAFSMND